MIARAPFIRLLDTNGDGTGTKIATGNYAGDEVTFYIEPPADEDFIIHDMSVVISDDFVVFERYGNAGAGPLTEGLRVNVISQAFGTIDLTDGVKIKATEDWFKLAQNAYKFGSMGVVEYMTFHVDFRAILPGIIQVPDGTPGGILLRGHASDQLVVGIDGDLTDLNDHYFRVSGTRIIDGESASNAG
jgi:hypothetical protein